LGDLFLAMGTIAFLVLAGILAMVTMRHVISRAETMRGVAVVTQIDSAVNSYYAEYGALPDLPSTFPSNSEHGARLVRILGGDIREEERNPRGISFLLVNGLVREGSPSPSEAGFVDPFGNPYLIFLNTEYEDVFVIAPQGIRREVTGHVAVCSPGKDGVFGTDDDIDTLSR
jgi:hypothetical protein